MEHSTEPIPLQSLPFELQHLVIQYLDPIGLISLSQTGRFYRQLINPGRKEQVERLLALECLPEYGGDRPAILHPDSDEAVAGPDWHRDAWPEHHRWACAFCLRLLPHTHFDNHSLLRRRYRKPEPGSEVTPLTSWQPGSGRGAGQNARRRHQQRQAGAGNNPPRASQQLGWARTWRKCNECMFQRGELGHVDIGRPSIYTRRQGTPEVPIQISRRVVFRSVLDRYFPGLEASLESGPRPFPLRKDTLSRADVSEETWTMYMVRCPGCQRWQEQRAFQIGDCNKHWKPRVGLDGRLMGYNELWTEPSSVMLDEVRCNGCFVREHGHQALRWKLVRLFRRVIQELFFKTQSRLNQPWSSSSDTYSNVPEQYMKEFWEMQRKAHYGAVEGRDCFETKDGIVCMTDYHVATLTTLHEEFKTLWTVMRTHADFVEEDFLEDARFMAWFNCYHESEAIWKWLREVLCEVERNPDMLVTWALGRDGASLM
ncbi:unnamed protein product [Clonostachys rhizophaga]|uniref:F-box domain-containing protein n=1 Tax=Clonostachys rhizophaga TaxID=160324 RepID=A0A9N9YMP8_9HYPO|nr:unnamed protein product [Clonostachys rhizophaga]